MSTSTGGPAFPHLSLPVPGHDPEKIRQNLTGGGMTLRDYFAAKAMQGLLHPECPLKKLSEVPFAAYEIADAMLNARQA